MNFKSLQINLNHSRRAQDLMFQHAKEFKVNMVFVSEPYKTEGGGDWFSSLDGKSAILLFNSERIPTFSRVQQGNGFIAMNINNYLMISCYFSPNRPLDEFSLFLDELYYVLRDCTLNKIVVAGDFNARSTSWRDTVTNDRGILLERWMDSTGLSIANNNFQFTCVKDRGGSIIDLTLISDAVPRNKLSWKLRGDVLSLSDHRYIGWQFCDTKRHRGHKYLPRKGWKMEKLDSEKFQSGFSMSQDYIKLSDGAIDHARLLVDLIGFVCDSSMPRAKAVHIRRTYWWSDELAELRRICIRSRRKLTRAKKQRNYQNVNLVYLRSDYNVKVRNFKNAISKAQQSSWNELLEEINKDPWA